MLDVGDSFIKIIKDKKFIVQRSQWTSRTKKNWIHFDSKLDKSKIFNGFFVKFIHGNM